MTERIFNVSPRGVSGVTSWRRQTAILITEQATRLVASNVTASL